MRHTEGPWVIGPETGRGEYININHCHPDQVGAITLTLARVAARQTWREEAKANANLISAAPDLLEALGLCASVLAGHEMSKSALTRALEKAAAAMKKAKGTEDPR